MKRTYDFGPEQVKRIERLAMKLRIDKTDVLTQGARLIEIAVRAAESGESLGVIPGRSLSGTIVGPWMDLEPRPAA